MPDARIVPLADAPVGAEDVIALWRRQGVLREDEARRRAAEVLLVGLVGDELVGVSSARLSTPAQLGLPLWFVRVYVAPDHRNERLAGELAREGIAHLRARWLDGSDTRAAGVGFEVQSEVLQQHVTRAIWRRTQAVFVGELPGGAHLRVTYFPGALAPQGST